MENIIENGNPRQLTPAEWLEEFNKETLMVKQAAEEWAVRWNEPEGKFISALLSATSMQGRLVASWQGTMNNFTTENRHIVQNELNILSGLQTQADHILKQGELAIRQARQIQHTVVVERENLVEKMVTDTLPMFAKTLKGAMVIREQGYNAEARDRRFVIAAGVTTALFMFGYLLSWWQDSSLLSAVDRCLAQPVQIQGQYYCAAANLFGPVNSQNGGSGEN